MSTRRRTQRQNTRYWGLVNRLPHLKSDETDRRSVTLHVTRKRSTRDLSISEMNALCAYLEYLLGERPLADVDFPNKVSAAQRSEISRTEKDLGWTSNPQRLEGFCLRITQGRTGDVDELTRREAQKVLNGLKSMAKRQEETTAGTANARE